MLGFMVCFILDYLTVVCLLITRYFYPPRAFISFS